MMRLMRMQKERQFQHSPTESSPLHMGLHSAGFLVKTRQDAGRASGHEQQLCNQQELSDLQFVICGMFVIAKYAGNVTCQ